MNGHLYWAFALPVQFHYQAKALERKTGMIRLQVYNDYEGGHMGKGRIAELQDVRFYSLDEIENDGNAFCHIKGMLFHSGMVVEHVEMKSMYDAMLVTVSMVPIRSGLSGAFDIEVPLSSITKSVIFGASRTPVWTRVSCFVS